MEIMEHYGDDGTIRKLWNIAEIMEHYGNYGTLRKLRNITKQL